MHSIATLHGSCTDTVREFAMKADAGEKGKKNTLPHLGLEPASVLCLAFQSDALATEVFPLVPFIFINFVVIVCFDLELPKASSCKRLH